MTWQLVADQLERRGHHSLAPDLHALPAALTMEAEFEGAAEPYWRRHARAAAEAFRSIPTGPPPILVGHSGAGPLLPAIRQEAGRPVAAYVFVDAGLPKDGQSRLGPGEFGQQVRELYAAGDRFPNWSDEDLRAVVPDPELRHRLLSELRPPPLAFWEESIPVFAGWPDAPCAYLRFVPNPSYDDAASEARRRAWPCAEIPGHHFHMLVDPRAVAAAILRLLEQMGIP